MFDIDTMKNTIYNMDCLEGMAMIPDKSIDMILSDLPYGTTSCSWDHVIDPTKLWDQYERIIKDEGAIVLTGCQPFTSKLVISNIELFKYEWIWIKTILGNPFEANFRPLRKHENILVFSKGGIASNSNIKMKYSPQGTSDINKIRKNIKKDRASFGGNRKGLQDEYEQKRTGYPTTLIETIIDGENGVLLSTNTIIPFKSEKGLHVTQKPVALFEYLINTYTQNNEIVLDSCMGSFTTAIACLNTGRNFIGFEIDEEYFEEGKERLRKFLKDESCKLFNTKT
jgi:site-specific DNA-methyltransferase (adenine-specific)